MLGVLWYAGTIAAAYMYLLGSGIAHALSPVETAIAAIPVGTIVAPWIVYIVASLISNLGCARDASGRSGDARPQPLAPPLP